MAQKARDLQVTPRALADEMSAYFRALFDKLEISYDRFIRTTEDDHHRASQAIWQAMEANGDLYLDRYEGWYSIRDEAYYDEMERQVSGLGDDPTEIVMGVVRADLSAALLNERSAKIWHAFRGVASANPDIARFSDTRDYRLRQTLRQVFDRIVREEGREAEQTLARDATYGTLVMMEGMWTDFLTHMSGFDRGEAERIVRRFLKGLFPSSF